MKRTLIGLMLGAAALSPEAARQVQIAQLPTPLKLQASEARLLGLTEREGIVQYAYDSGVALPDTPSAEVAKTVRGKHDAIVAEVVDLRTDGSRTWELASGQMVTEIISGSPQYRQSEQGWTIADYGTTTRQAYDLQTKSTLDRVLDVIAPRVQAQTTFYPDPHTETATVDGRVIQTYTTGSGQSWNTIVNAAGTSASDTETEGGIAFNSDSTSNNWRFNRRAIYLFDTSSIPDTDAISSAVMSLSCNDKRNETDYSGTWNVYSSAPASNTALAAGDYDSVGTTQFATGIAFASINIAGYNDWTFNATGIAAVSKTGVSKFSVMVQVDPEEIAGDPTDPTWSNNEENGIGCYFADQTGTTNDPKLVVTHGPAPAEVPKPKPPEIGPIM